MGSENKTKPTEVSAEEFLATVEHPTRREDGEVLVEMMGRLTGHPPVMWGPSIIGFDQYHYVYASGREGDAPLVGFSPRKTSLSLYLNLEFDGATDLLEQLGKHKLSKACLYINKLADVDLAVLEELISRGYQDSLSDPAQSGVC